MALYATRLLVILISFIVDNIEESELVDTLRSRNNSEPISQLLLLEELLCPERKVLAGCKCSRRKKHSQVFEVSSRELLVGSDLDFTITDLLDLDDVAEVTNTAVDLDLILEEFLEGADIEDLVAGRLRSVDDELRDSLVFQILNQFFCQGYCRQR
jgi:hypothetical protein